VGARIERSQARPIGAYQPKRIARLVGESSRPDAGLLLQRDTATVGRPPRVLSKRGFAADGVRVRAVRVYHPYRRGETARADSREHDLCPVGRPATLHIP